MPNKLLSRIITAIVMTFCFLPAFSGISDNDIAPEDSFRYPWSFTGKTIELPEKWAGREGNSAEYATPGFNDSSWNKYKAGMDLRRQEMPGREGWLRCTFSLSPGDLDSFWILDCGRIGGAEEIYLNGKLIGAFGFDKKSKKLEYGCSLAHRYYLLPAQILKSGSNTLAVHNYFSGSGGFYQSRPLLREVNIQKSPLLVRFRLRPEYDNGMENMLTHAKHLNVFRLGTSIRIQMEFFSMRHHGKFILKIEDENKSKADINLLRGNWSRSDIITFHAPDNGGNHFLNISLEDKAGNVWWRDSIPYCLTNQGFKLKTIGVDSSLSTIPVDSFDISVSDAALGSFGPRFCDMKNMRLVDDFNMPDGRGGSTMCLLAENKLNSPLMFMGAMARQKRQHMNFHSLLGGQYDGFDNCWIFGHVSPDSGNLSGVPSVTDRSWNHLTYRYKYSSGIFIDATVSNLNPALRFNTDAKKIRIFDRAASFGSSLPALIEFAAVGKIRAVPASQGLSGREMTENWLLLSFGDNMPDKAFEMPFLLVFEKRPDSVKNNSGALEINWNTPGGTFQLMPLYGKNIFSILTPLPEDRFKRATKFSRLLVAPQHKVSRTVFVDDKSDRIIFREQFEHLSITDDWNTSPLRAAQIPGALSLANHSGNIKIFSDRKLHDLDYPMLHGPMVVAENTSEIRYAIDGMLRLVREEELVKKSREIENSPASVTLNRLVDAELNKEPRLSASPWKRFIYDNGCFCVGIGNINSYLGYYLRMGVFLDPGIRRRYEADVHSMLGKYLFKDDCLDPITSLMLKPHFRERQLIERVYNPANGLIMALQGGYCDRRSGDLVCFVNAWINVVDLYARHFDKLELVRKNMKTMEQFFNLTRTVTDYQTMLCWDSLSGIRIGNGLQESGTVFLGNVSMARIAHLLGKYKLRNQAAALAVQQLIGMQAQLAATEWRRNNQPWSSLRSNADSITELEMNCPAYWVEPNELNGYDAMVIQGKKSAWNTKSFIMTYEPEITRLYTELWPDFTRLFYTFPGKDSIDKNPGYKDLLNVVFRIVPPDLIPDGQDFYDNAINSTSVENRIRNCQALLEHKSRKYYHKVW